MPLIFNRYVSKFILGLKDLLVGSGEDEAAVNLVGELDGFSIDFLSNTFATKLTSAAEKLELLFGDEWNGLALDFTSNLRLVRSTVGGEQLLGTGPNMAEVGLGLDFTDNTYAIRN